MLPLLEPGDKPAFNQLILDERNYNLESLKKKHDNWLKMLTPEQKKVYDEIMDVVLNDKGGVFSYMALEKQGKPFCGRFHPQR